MPTLQGEAIARAIRDHQITASNLWRYRDLLAELHLWVDRFDQDFDLALPTPVIAIRAWEEWHCNREKGGWYHSVAWREKMAEIGIVADAHGRHQRVSSRFTTYLNRYGVPTLDTLLRGEVEVAIGSPPTKRRQMPKWSCACPGGRPARAILINAQCLDCGQLYRQVGG